MSALCSACEEMEGIRISSKSSERKRSLFSSRYCSIVVIKIIFCVKVEDFVKNKKGRRVFPEIFFTFVGVIH